jgi:hypothetical protein
MANNPEEPADITPAEEEQAERLARAEADDDGYYSDRAAARYEDWWWGK